MDSGRKNSVLLRGVLRPLSLFAVFLLFVASTEANMVAPDSFVSITAIEEETVSEYPEEILIASGDVLDVESQPARGTEPKRDEAALAEGPFVSIVIDDFGYSRKVAEEFAVLKLPHTWAILPFERFSAFCGEKAEKAEIPYIIHMPMGAVKDSGQEQRSGIVIDAGMSPEEIADALLKATDSLPGAVGLNNHRGSRATADDALMDSLMEILSGFPLFFLDSRTASASVAYKKAVEKGIPSLYSSIFLDHRTTEKYMEEQFRRGIAMAKRRGWVVMIAHTRSATLDFLRKIENSAADEAVFVTLPELMHLLGIR